MCVHLDFGPNENAFSSSLRHDWFLLHFFHLFWTSQARSKVSRINPPSTSSNQNWLKKSLLQGACSCLAHNQLLLKLYEERTFS